MRFYKQTSDILVLCEYLKKCVFFHFRRNPFFTKQLWVNAISGEVLVKTFSFVVPLIMSDVIFVCITVRWSGKSFNDWFQYRTLPNSFSSCHLFQHSVSVFQIAVHLSISYTTNAKPIKFFQKNIIINQVTKNCYNLMMSIQTCQLHV